MWPLSPLTPVLNVHIECVCVREEKGQRLREGMVNCSSASNRESPKGHGSGAFDASQLCKSVQLFSNALVEGDGQHAIPLLLKLAGEALFLLRIAP